jgi:hypothetical protein
MRYEKFSAKDGELNCAPSPVLTSKKAPRVFALQAMHSARRPSCITSFFSHFLVSLL